MSDMKLYELLKKTKPNDVILEIKRLYKDQEKNEDGYRRVYEELLRMTPGSGEPGFRIELRLETTDDGEPWLITRGIEDGEEISYGLELYPWAELLGTEITPGTLAGFKAETIVAGCLYEMTFFGFTEDKIRETEERWSKAIEEDLE
jgi:hypothetical protein